VPFSILHEEVMPVFAVMTFVHFLIQRAIIVNMLQFFFMSDNSVYAWVLWHDAKVVKIISPVCALTIESSTESCRSNINDLRVTKFF